MRLCIDPPPLTVDTERFPVRVLESLMSDSSRREEENVEPNETPATTILQRSAVAWDNDRVLR
jgi:hypothetical protein